MVRRLFRDFQDSGRWVSGTEAMVLVLAMVTVIVLWLFITVADWFISGRAMLLDEAIVRMFRKPGDRSELIGPPWVFYLVRDGASMGGLLILSLVTIASVVFMLLCGRQKTAIFCLSSVAMGMFVGYFVRSTFHRTHLNFIPVAARGYFSSFLSGHSLMSSIVYVTLATVSCRRVQSRYAKAFLLFVGLLVPAIVGCSRIILGVHYPTDVLAGWVVGISWAFMAWLSTLYLETRDIINEP